MEKNEKLNVLPDEELGKVAGGVDAGGNQTITATVTGYILDRTCPVCGHDIWSVGQGEAETNGDKGNQFVFYPCAACTVMNNYRRQFGIPEHAVPALNIGVNPSLVETTITITFKL